MSHHMVLTQDAVKLLLVISKVLFRAAGGQLVHCCSGPRGLKCFCVTEKFAFVCLWREKGVCVYVIQTKVVIFLFIVVECVWGGERKESLL